jgi:hypothetical protein
MGLVDWGLIGRYEMGKHLISWNVFSSFVAFPVVIFS